MKSIEVPFNRYLVTLRMTRPAGFRFYHGAVVMGLLKAALDGDIPAGLLPFPCELGDGRVEPRETYRLGLTLIGGARVLAGRVRTGLDRLGASDPPRDRSLPTLKGNFLVEHFDLLPIPDVAAQVATLTPLASELPLRLLTPLCVERPRPEQHRLEAAHHDWPRERRRFFAGGDLPVDVFLSRLWDRAFELTNGREPTEPDRRSCRPPLPRDAALRPRRLRWVKVEKADNRDRALVLAGPLGTALLAGAGQDWLPWLVLGQYLHVGNGKHYGCGAYRLGAGAPSRGHRGDWPTRKRRARTWKES